MHRPASGAPLAGVCAALAERTGIDPLVIRVAAVLFAVSSGIGVVLYLAGWLLIPREGHERGPLLETFPALTRAPRWALVGILAVTLVVVAVLVGQSTPTTMFPAVVVGLVYYFGVHRPRNRVRLRTDAPSPATPVSPTPPSITPAAFASGASPAGMPPARPFGAEESAREADSPTLVRPPAPEDPLMAGYLAHPDPIGLYAPPPPTPRAARLPDPQRVGKRTLGLVTLTTLGLLWTGLSLVATTGTTFPMYAWAAASLIVVGAALVIAAWVGRPRGLVPVAVLLALLATIGSVRPGHPIPQPVMAPESVTYALTDALPTADMWDLGVPTVDLSDLAPTEDVTYTAHINAGSLTILVPDDVRVVVNGRVAMGSMTLGDRFVEAPPAEGVITEVVSEGEPGSPTITIDASAEFGELVVRSS